MTRPELENLDGMRVLAVSRPEGLGNILLLEGEGDDMKVLKLYRERRSRTKEIFSAFSHRVFERKRGATARARCETERLSLDTWERHGFDVFKRLDLPLPDRFAPPGVWFEYCSGQPLAALIRSPEMDLEKKLSLMHRLGEALSRRHRVAHDLADVLLVQDHATLDHVFVSGDRLITYDFEGGFLPGFPILEALAQEMAVCLRSLSKRSGEHFERLLRVLVEGYGDTTLLHDIAHWGVHNRSCYRRVRRWYDQRRRPERSKTDGLRFLLSMLDAG